MRLAKFTTALLASLLIAGCAPQSSVLSSTAPAATNSTQAPRAAVATMASQTVDLCQSGFRPDSLPRAELIALGWVPVQASQRARFNEVILDGAIIAQSTMGEDLNFDDARSDVTTITNLAARSPNEIFSFLGGANSDRALLVLHMPWPSQPAAMQRRCIYSGPSEAQVEDFIDTVLRMDQSDATPENPEFSAVVVESQLPRNEGTSRPRATSTQYARYNDGETILGRTPKATLGISAISIGR